VVQRFGGALNLNVHFHALVLEGVFARAADGRLWFHRAAVPVAADVADELAGIVPGVQARLARAGVDDDGAGGDGFAAAAPLLAGLVAASVAGARCRWAVCPGAGPSGGARGEGPQAGVGSDAPHARWEGFDLHAGVAVPAGHPARLERVCRYALRPPVTGERLTVDGDGQVVLQLRRRWGGRYDGAFCCPVYLDYRPRPFC
jgi:hypothetical protein